MPAANFMVNVLEACEADQDSPPPVYIALDAAFTAVRPLPHAYNNNDIIIIIMIIIMRY